MSDQPSSVDVSELPDYAFDHRDSMWWGATAFMMIEGTTVAVALASYFYLSRNVEAWPPPPTPLPTLWPALLAMLVAMLSAVPAYLAAQRAGAMDASGVRRYMIVNSAIETILVLLRIPEFAALNTRWDSHAYGSIVWTVLGLQTAVAVTDLADTIGLTAVFVRGREANRHFPAVRDNSMYWYFVVVSWVIVDLVVFVGPRMI